MHFNLAVDQMLCNDCQLESKLAIKVKFSLYTLRWNVHLGKVNYCDDTGPGQKLRRVFFMHMCKPPL